jgi:Family of unknown function (DUF5675)
MKLVRYSKCPEGIFSTLTDDTGKSYFTAEHSYSNLPKIPNGIFTCVRGQHQLESGPIETFEITGVEGHTGLLIHYGNLPQTQSDGCILIGDSCKNSEILNSRASFQTFMSNLTGINSFTLSVE